MSLIHPFQVAWKQRKRLIPNKPQPKPETAAAPDAPDPIQPTRTSPRGVNLIKSFEGLRLKAYLDSAGVWTIGYGHTRNVHPGQVINEAEALGLLRADLQRFEDCVSEMVTHELTQGQYDALVSFAFNVGCGALKKSTLLRKLNAGDTAGAAQEFGRWVHAGGKRLRGLERRREAEKSLFGGSLKGKG